MQLGAAVEELQVSPGTRFGGFWNERPAAAAGVHDPLLCQALVAEGDGRAALVSLDLQLISRTAVRAIAGRLGEDPGIAPEALLVHATHDHAAPGGDAAEAFVEGAGDHFAEPQVEALVVDAAVRAVRAAWARRAPGRIAYAAGEIAGIGRFRSDPSAPARAPAALLRIEDGRGAARAIVAWYGCHASVLGPDNELFSADYPSVVRGRLRAAHPGAEALFFNAPAADVSTRNTRREQTFGEMERLGGLLADELLALAESARPLGGEAVEAAVREVRLPLPPGVPGEGERARRLRALFGSEGVPFACQVVHIGDLRVVALEAEIGFALGQQVLARARAGGRPALVVSPAGGSVGNVPSRTYAAEAAETILAGVDTLCDALA
jgi:neutral ceramidase